MIDDAMGRERRAPDAERTPPGLPTRWRIQQAVAMAVVGADGRIAAVSDRWAAMSGWPRRSLVGRPWDEVVEPSALPPPGSAAPEVEAQAPLRVFRLRVSAPDGRVTVLQAQASPLDGSGRSASGGGRAAPPGGWLVVGVGGQSGGPPGAAASSTPTDGSDLVASVSHELRTPLTSIVSFTQLLRDGLGDDEPARQREYLDIIERNSDRLLRLVDDLLLLDRLESSDLSLDCEPVDLPTLVEVAVSSIRPMAEEKGLSLELTTTDGPPLHADVDRLGQLVDNLLANAVKFTPSAGSVRVGAHPFEQGWRFVVADTGIGIPEEERGRLFQRFYRASNARRDGASGSGLGLVIARRIAELHCGSIVVDSEVGRGTVATVELGGAPAGSAPLAESRTAR